jgi:hypothetical protein
MRRVKPPKTIKERRNMKKFTLAVLALAIAAFIATSAQAEEKYVAGGFEASGNIVVGGGWTHNTSKFAWTYATTDGDYGYGPGVLGKYMNPFQSPKSDQFSFFVDQVELDLMKSFGENIRLRADLNFGRTASSGFVQPAFVLEQAYATANIPIGNGLEFLLGRFNTPIGFESVDVIDNDTISKSVLVTGLRPANTTGLKLYYSFSDLVDLHFYIVNTLTQDSDVKINAIPSFGLRLGFNWGEKGNQSTFGFSPFFGPETRGSNKHFTLGGDFDLNWWITEAFALGAEGLFRRDANAVNVVGYVPDANNTYIGGLLNLHYAFSDVWDGTLKYVFAKQYHGSNGGAVLPGDTTWMNLTGGQQALHQIALAGGYQVADGAKMKMEGRFDIVNPAGASNTYYNYGLALAFAYNF